MSLSIGIVGLPNVGKSTLFNALTEKSVSAENFPFCTIDPSVGLVGVPDKRLAKLSELSQSEKTIPAAVEFVDIAGLVKGAAEGEGLGNQFLAHIREVDAIAQVVRLFDDPHVTHVHGDIDPVHDIEVINLELVLADLQTVSKRIANLERDVKRGEKDAIAEHTALQKLAQTLESGKLAATCHLSEDEKKTAKQFHLLTSKPILYVLNKKAGGHNIDELNDERWEKLKEFFDECGAPFVLVDANIEQELSLVAIEDKQTFRQEFGVSDDGINNLIQTGYKILNLITYFTTGEKETRAWTIVSGSTAPQAGAVIHSDFEDKFIRADVISWEKLLEAGSNALAREKGWVQTEGKEYVVADGDVIEFKI